MKKIFTEVIHNKLAFSSLIVLIVMYVLTLFAGFFSPYSYKTEDPAYAYAPPARIHFYDPQKKKIYLYVYKYKMKMNEFFQRSYTEDKAKKYPLKLFVRGDKYYFLGMKQTNLHLFGAKGAKVFLFGADYRGRDIFSRLFYGARVSLSIGLIGAAISFFLGVLIGSVSGYFGGTIDNIIMRFCEMIMMIPGFYLLLALRASFPPNINSAQIYFLLIIILSFIGWASIARVIRGITLSLSKQEFILALKSLGFSNIRIIFKHIIPHTFSYTIIAVALSIPSYILGEAALSLIGLGIQEPYPSWGNMLSDAMGIVKIKFYPWILIPGIFIFIAVFCFNSIADALRDSFDPKRKIF